MKQFMTVLPIMVLGFALSTFGQEGIESKTPVFSSGSLSSAVSSAPKTISYQGLLIDSSGVPLEGSYDLTFGLYDVQTGGTALWTEVHTAVPVSNGTFSVVLGSTVSLEGVNFNQQLYLGIAEGPNPEFSPRSALTSAPSALAPWRSNGDSLYYNGGNVGIGTSSPSAKLDVAGTVKITDGTQGSGKVLTSDASGVASWQAPNTNEADGIVGNEVTGAANTTLSRTGSGTAVSPYQLSLNLANANTWTAAQTFNTTTNFPGGVWNSSGNLGIGTTSPTQSLEIIRAVPIVNIQSANNTSGFGAELNLQRSRVFGIPTIVSNNDELGEIEFNGYDGSSFLTAAEIIAAVDGAPGSSEIPGRLVFSTSDNSNFPTERMRITSSGKVGIGTTVPLQTFEVIGVDTPAIGDIIGFQRDGASRFRGGFAALDIGATSAIAPIHSWIQSRNANNQAVEYPLVLNPTGGNVGIGTSSPSSVLHLRATNPSLILQPSAAGAQQAAIEFRSDANGDGFGIGRDYGLNNFFIYDQIANLHRLYINDIGNVGIGTTSPAAKLHVNGTGRFSGRVSTDHATTDDNNAAFSNTSATGYGLYSRGGSGSNYIAHFTDKDDASKVIISGTGNVGIGTSSPAALLHVNGSAGNTTGTWSNLSDRRLKKEIEPIQDALSTVTRLNGVTFRWKDEAKDTQYGRVRGLIAQEVERVIPEWIKTDPDGYKRIEPIGVDALLIQAIKEQQKQIDELRALVMSLAKEKNESMGEIK